MYEIHSNVFRTCNFFFTQTKIVVLINRPREPIAGASLGHRKRQAIASMASDGRHPCRQKRSPSGPPCSHHEDMTRLFFFISKKITDELNQKSFFLIFQIETRAGGCGARATEATSADRGLLSTKAAVFFVHSHALVGVACEVLKLPFF